jgi:hypothetical protein
MTRPVATVALLLRYRERSPGAATVAGGPETSGT